jgi:hypothetical protein
VVFGNPKYTAVVSRKDLDPYTMEHSFSILLPKSGIHTYNKIAISKGTESVSKLLPVAKRMSLECLKQ